MLYYNKFGSGIMNYDKLMEEEIESIEKKDPTLLLHACCAPCSSACLERLGDRFKISILYYNPNITEADEYNKRLNEKAVALT